MSSIEGVNQTVDGYVTDLSGYVDAEMDVDYIDLREEQEVLEDLITRVVSRARKLNAALETQLAKASGTKAHGDEARDGLAATLEGSSRPVAEQLVRSVGKVASKGGAEYDQLQETRGRLASAIFGLQKSGNAMRRAGFSLDRARWANEDIPPLMKSVRDNAEEFKKQ